MLSFIVYKQQAACNAIPIVAQKLNIFIFKKAILKLLHYLWKAVLHYEHASIMNTSIYI